MVGFGSRSVKDIRTVELAVQASPINPDELTLVVQGDAPGADRLFDAWAKARGIETKSWPADWDDIEGKPPYEIGTRVDGRRYWKRAGLERNKLMAMFVKARNGYALGVWDRSEILGIEGSSGTKQMMEYCRDTLGLPGFVYTADDYLRDTGQV